MQAASPAWNVPTRKLVDLRGACLLQSERERISRPLCH